MTYEHPARAFLSHSSIDKAIVLAVYEALSPNAAWLDRAEIEWGKRFLDAIEDGISSATDFVLFWSATAAKSEWVKHETHMAFIRALGQRAIRIKVVKLDGTDLPLRLQPFHFLSVEGSETPIDDIISALQPALSQPTSGTRHRFLNRNEELERVETMINDSETRVILLHGFKGVGKAATVHEALRRFFEGASIIELTVRPGTGPAELALQIHYEAFRTVLPETTKLEALAAIEKSVATIIERGQFIVIKDCQHWFGTEQDWEEPLPTLIRQVLALSQTYRKPVFLTSTWRPRIPFELATHLANIHISGLGLSHMASLIALWYEVVEGGQLDTDDAARVAAELHGHPIAAKLAANLIAQHGSVRLLEYPAELVALRRDLAKTLIRDLELSNAACRLLETLAIVSTPLPSRVLAEAMQMDNDNFHAAVEDATRAGIAEVTPHSTKLGLHPLVSDHFWRSHLDHEDYTLRAQQVVGIVHSHLEGLSTETADFVALLPAVCRLYALAGDIAKAQEVRRGLTGELSQAAITHYNRRRLDLAEKFILLVLEGEPQHWRMRMYLARIHIRKNRWDSADELIDALLRERPRDRGIRHLRGWRLLRASANEEALAEFSRVLATDDRHVASYRDSAECLYRLGRPAEALEFLAQAKHIESDNPFTLDLEARIHEEMGQFEQALAAARVAVVRNPSNWGLRHRLSRILTALAREAEALEEAKEAVRLDPAQFTARSHLISLLIDGGNIGEAGDTLKPLLELSVNQKQRDICEHLHARIEYRKGELDRALALVQGQIGRGRNLAASYGLLASIRLTQAEQAPPNSATAELYLNQAADAISNCERQDGHDLHKVEALKARLRVVTDLICPRDAIPANTGK